MTVAWGSIALLLWGYFTLWFLLALMVRNTGIVDIGWGGGFVLLSIWSLVGNFTLPGLILAASVWCWGLRLVIHIGFRNVGKPEDFRYAAFRRDWGRSFVPRAYLQLYLFQGLLMGIIALPFLYALPRGVQAAPEGFTGGIALTGMPFWAFFLLGFLIWLAGFLCEAIADAQLRRFTQSPANKGRIMDIGLWKYTRHPNYFGESVSWWGIYLMSAAMGAPLWTCIGPLTITLVIRYLSGVPMLEKRLVGRAGYEDYCKNTPIFIPHWPKPGRKERE